MVSSRRATRWRRFTAAGVALAIMLTGTSVVAVVQASPASAAATTLYQANIQGGATEAANTLYTTSTDSTGTRVAADVDPSTSMSSESDLILPAGSTVVRAFLELEIAGYSSTGPTSLKFKLPGSASYTSLTTASPGFLSSTATPVTAIAASAYQLVWDVTPSVAALGSSAYVSSLTPGGHASGNGSFYVADPSPLPTDSNFFMGGWAMDVVYTNPASPLRNVTVDTNWQTYDESTVTTDIPGVVVPSVGPVKAVVGATALYGDPTLKDSISFGLSSNPTPTALTSNLPTSAALATTDAMNSVISFASNNNVTADGGPALPGCYSGRDPDSGFTIPAAYPTPNDCSAEYDASVFNATGTVPPSTTPVSVRITQTSITPPIFQPIEVLYSGMYFVSIDLAAPSLTKSLSPTTIADGGTATYSFAVTNNGDRTITHANIVDISFSGTGTPPDISQCPAQLGVIPVGQTKLCTVSYTVTQADIDAGVIDNQALGQGFDPSGTEFDTNDSSATVTATSPPVTPLAFTGVDARLQLILAALFIGLGGALIVTRRRPPRDQAPRPSS